MKTKSFSTLYFKISMLSVLVFFLLYNISFRFNESLTTGRIAVVILFAWVLFVKQRPEPLLRSKTWLLFLPVPYVALQYFLIGDFGQLSRFIHLAFYSYIGAALVVVIARDVKVVLGTILVAITIQAAIILFSFFSLEYRALFDAIAVAGSNYDAFNPYRAPGFAGAGGASLSLIQSLGVFVGWLLLRKNRFYEAVSGIRVYLVLSAMILSLISCVVVGRTGLLLSVIFMGMFWLSVGIRPGIIILSLVVLLSLYLVTGNYLISLLGDDFSLEYFKKWAFGFFTGDDDTLKIIYGMTIPPLTIETIQGTGLVSLIDGANPSGNDTGFIQTYFSMGLHFTVLFYAIYLYVLFHLMSWFPTLMRMALVFLFFAIEAKEPFLFKYSTMFVLMSLHFSHVVINKKLRAEFTQEQYEDHLSHKLA